MWTEKQDDAGEIVHAFLRAALPETQVSEAVQATCLHCSNKFVTSYRTPTLLLAAPAHPCSLQSILAAMANKKEERLCCNCARHAFRARRLNLVVTGDLLVIELERGSVHNKNHTGIELDPSITIAGHSWKLAGAAVHVGTQHSSGHWITAIPAAERNWTIFNDDK